MDLVGQGGGEGVVSHGRGQGIASHGSCRIGGQGGRRLKHWWLHTETWLREHDGRCTESCRVRDTHGIVIIGGAPDKGHQRSSGQTHRGSDGVNCRMGIRVWELNSHTVS